MQREIVVPETEPATEWILGRAVQKVIPQRRHAVAQAWLGGRLQQWARGRGVAGTGWQFRIAPPRELFRPLVPDVAYVSFERLGDAQGEERESPLVAPNVAVEILSPGERFAHLRHKVEVYLAAGTEAVLVVDPAARTLTVYDADGVRALAESDTFAHDALPGFIFALADMFAELDER